MKTILYVHDLQRDHFDTGMYLQMAGYRVVLQPSPFGCLDQIDREDAKLVLLDVLLEGPTGFEVCRQIRERYSVKQLPIIMMSDIYRSEIFVQEATETGAQHYLIRPFNPQKLAALVDRELGIRRETAVARAKLDQRLAGRR